MGDDLNIMLPRHLVSRILLQYIPNQNKLNFQAVLQQLQQLFYKFQDNPIHYYHFYQWWVWDLQRQHSLYNGYYKIPKAYILNEYQQRCQLFKNQPYPNFFETKYPIRFRYLLHELHHYFRFKLSYYPDPLYTPIGYYTLEGYQYNRQLCLEGLKKIHNI